MWSNYGKITEFIAGENILNNNLYIIDRKTQRIMKPINPDEWWRNEIVWVYNTPVTTQENYPISEGTACRCWRVWLSL